MGKYIFMENLHIKLAVLSSFIGIALVLITEKYSVDDVGSKFAEIKNEIKEKVADAKDVVGDMQEKVTDIAKENADMLKENVVSAKESIAISNPIDNMINNNDKDDEFNETASGG